ncbi:hypothetical protein PMAYCL1PPCAC_14172, partial [Pristionchus mayeri]
IELTCYFCSSKGNTTSDAHSILSTAEIVRLSAVNLISTLPCCMWTRIERRSLMMLTDMWRSAWGATMAKSRTCTRFCPAENKLISMSCAKETERNLSNTRDS